MIITASADPTPRAAATFCDAGADTRRGRTPPAAWVGVTIQSIGNAAGNGPCTPDAKGQMLHCLFRFARPTEARGKRREIAENFRPSSATSDPLAIGPGMPPIDVECDGGKFWIGTRCSLFWRGGTVGDRYEVQITENVPRDETDPKRLIDIEEPAFIYSLTSYFYLPGNEDIPVPFINFPTPLPYFQHFEVGQGAARILMPTGGIIPIDASAGKAGRVPLSSPQIQVSTGFYRVLGGC